MLHMGVMVNQIPVPVHAARNLAAAAVALVVVVAAAVVAVAVAVVILVSCEPVATLAPILLVTWCLRVRGCLLGGNARIVVGRLLGLGE